MSEYSHVEKPLPDQLAALDWTVIDQGYTATMQNRAPKTALRISVPSRKVDHDA